jgi:hypothetical protein
MQEHTRHIRGMHTHTVPVMQANVMHANAVHAYIMQSVRSNM